MARLHTLKIKNFKAFPYLKKFNFEGKHVLIFGENGSGKSSIFWALYTLLQASVPSKNFNKYFDRANLENLLNIFTEGITDDSDISISFDDSPNDFYILNSNSLTKPQSQVALQQVPLTPNTVLEETNEASDFINHKILLNFYNYHNSKEIDLFPVFVRDILPFWTTDKGNNLLTLYNKLLDQKPFFLRAGRIHNSQSNHWDLDTYNDKVNEFNSKLDALIGDINRHVNSFYSQYFNNNQNDLQIKLTYVTKLKYDYLRQKRTLNQRSENYISKDIKVLNKPFIKLTIIENINGRQKEIDRPQSYLNEAKITGITLAIRFTILNLRPKQNVSSKILALDDFLLSLDMSNREVALNLLFDRYLHDFQFIIITHDNIFFEFVKLFIRQKSTIEDWKVLEMYSGNEDATGAVDPIVIDSDFGYSEKAIKYFEARDYVTCSFYIRKTLEKLVDERLPEEFKTKFDGKPKDLKLLWSKVVGRYANLGFQITDSVKNGFEQTKLMLLNPQAHHNLSYPVYKLELEKAFTLIRDFETNYPIPESKILLSKGMQMQFRHPTQNYTFDFELLSDFRIDGLIGNITIVLPKCKVLNWQFNGSYFWNSRNNTVLNQQEIETIQQREDKLDKIRDNLKRDANLAITDQMFLEHTILTNGVWTLSELIIKSGIQF